MRTSQLVFAFGFMVIFGGIQSPLAQVPARVAFEVASVKANKSNTAPSTIQLAFQPGGRFTATSVTVRELIRVAYGAPDPLDEARVIGGPGWTESDRFDIAAKAPTESGAQQLSLMLRSLLAERFNLTLRRELRELPIYSLVIAGPGGKLGPNLHASEDCTATHRETAPTAGDQAALCGVRGSPGRLIFGGMPISVLVFQPALVREVRRVVVDRTGLTGFFDGTLEWTPSALATAPFGTADAPSPPVDGPSIFAAVQEQLGLRLAPTKGPVEVFVVESVARPTPD